MALSRQDMRPDEVAIVDASEGDCTSAAAAAAAVTLEATGVRVLLVRLPGISIAAGRNAAIRSLAGDIIAVTDAGCSPEPEWFREITAPLLESRGDFVAGWFRPVAMSGLQRAIAVMTTSGRPPRGFLPSSRSVAFRRSLWERVGGYPEWLPWGEDSEYNRQCLRSGAVLVAAPAAMVAWPVRGSFGALARQFWRYAYGDGMARHVSASLLWAPAAIASSAAAATFGAWSVAMGLLALPIGLRVALRSRRLPWTLWPSACAVAVVTMASRAFGYMAGLMSRPRRPVD